MAWSLVKGHEPPRELYHGRQHYDDTRSELGDDTDFDLVGKRRTTSLSLPLEKVQEKPFRSQLALFVKPINHRIGVPGFLQTS